ncbi:hypothetical protein [Pectobacterium polaris]|uniref:hypothetical protein n=1 Tax=Pectobacterium polaris TaxID=2042057 RepID=UPI0015843277|nr:hypothetical protein [Pectobacterium polaris]
MIYFSEKQIQEYIWNARDDFSELLAEQHDIELHEFKDDLSDVTAKLLMRNKIKKRLSDLYSKLYGMKLIGYEVPLEQNSNSTIRADFLAVFPDDTGLAVVELKKSNQTERQAFTELLAYSNHMTTLFPAMTRDDSIYVLISPMETRIARDAVIQSLTFDNRSIVALVPRFTDPQDITTLRLHLWVPSESELSSFSNIAFREENFSVCKLSWEYDPGRWDAEKGKSPAEYLVNQFDNVSSLAAQHMEEIGIHGFTYCSQLWPELSDALPYTNSLVLVGLNPYAVGSVQYLMGMRTNEDDEIPDPNMYVPHISELIEKLGVGELYESNSEVLESLHRIWNSQLFRVGKKVIDVATKNTDGKYIGIEYGFMDWGTYQRSLLEDVLCHNFAIRSTGLMRHLYTDILNLDYEICKEFGLENHPIHGDMPYLGVDFLNSQMYFREFISRMFYSES